MSDPEVNDYCPGCGRIIHPGEAHVCRFDRERLPPRVAVRDFDRATVERKDCSPAALDAEAARRYGLPGALITGAMEAHYLAIKATAEAEAQMSAAVPTPLPAPAASLDEARTRAMIATVLQVEMNGIRRAIHDMTHDIQANSEIVRTLDVPLEQVHQSHERAANSFENLQKDMDKLGARVTAFEQVIDTAGLKRAQDGAEARFAKMLEVMERLVGEIVRLHGETLERARVELERNEARRANLRIPQKPHPKRKHR